MPKTKKILFNEISRLHKKQKATKKDLILSAIASSFAPNEENELVPLATLPSVLSSTKAAKNKNEPRKYSWNRYARPLKIAENNPTKVTKFALHLNRIRNLAKGTAIKSCTKTLNRNLRLFFSMISFHNSKLLCLQ